ncbi:hypothetical protein JTB14_028973 [Gonioctena quinquepunctata]|nr:hypothetical protein JTB14_028973 [Gonioctena quinquepunctata]
MHQNEADDYFTELGRFFEEEQLFDKPGEIFNMDETRLQFNKPENIANTIASEKEETITAIFHLTCIMKENTKTLSTATIIWSIYKMAYKDDNMPRHYKRATDRQSWSEESMSKTFGIPQSILRRHGLDPKRNGCQITKVWENMKKLFHLK